MKAPELKAETLIGQLVRSTTDEEEDLKRKAFEAGNMACRLSQSGLPYAHLVELWTGAHSGPLLRSHFWRGVNEA